MKSEKNLSPVSASVDNAISEAVKKKDNRINAGTNPQKAEINQKIVTYGVDNLLSSLTRPRCVKNDLNEIRSRTVEYLQRCTEVQVLPLIEDWAVALGLSRATLYRWFDKPGSAEIGEFLEQVRTLIYGVNAQAALQNSINSIGWIFYGKNSLGMADKTEVSVAAYNDAVHDDRPSMEELREKYLSIVDIDYAPAVDCVDCRSDD